MSLLNLQTGSGHKTPRTTLVRFSDRGRERGLLTHISVSVPLFDGAGWGTVHGISGTPVDQWGRTLVSLRLLGVEGKKEKEDLKSSQSPPSNLNRRCGTDRHRPPCPPRRSERYTTVYHPSYPPRTTNLWHFLVRDGTLRKETQSLLSPT